MLLCANGGIGIRDRLKPYCSLERVSSSLTLRTILKTFTANLIFWVDKGLSRQSKKLEIVGSNPTL